MPRNSQVIKGANQITVEWQDGNQDRAIVALDGATQQRHLEGKADKKAKRTKSRRVSIYT